MLTSQANAAHKIGLTPNKISVIGFILALASAVSYALTTPQTPVATYFGSCFPFSFRILRHMDGIVARTFQQTTVFGGFFDSVLDRYADAAVYAAIIVAGLVNPVWGPIWGSAWGLAL